MSLGLEVEAPEKECEDENCPFHGNLSARGSTFVGEVQSTKMDKSATVRWEYAESIPKYERYERRNTKISVHVPPCIDLEEGDHVKAVETQPISKTKSSVVVEINPTGDES